MISDPKTAGQVSKMMLEISSHIDESIALVRANCQEQEFQEYRRAAGRILGEILLEVLNPLYKQHDALKPPEFD
jgi:hypothetical protein